MLGLVCLLPAHNRNRHAWLALVAPLPVAALSLLLSMSDGASGGLGMISFFLTSLFAGWAGVWLLAPWLRARRYFVRGLLAWIVLALFGAVGYLGLFGFTVPDGTTGPWLGFLVVVTATLAASTTISGYLCRHGRPMYVFMLWLALWMPVSCFVAMTVFMIVMGIAMGEAEMIGVFLCSATSITVMLSLCLYVLNVPMMIVVRFNPLYRERFAGLFCPIELPGPFDLSDIPFDEPLSAELVTPDDGPEGDSSSATREPPPE